MNIKEIAERVARSHGTGGRQTLEDMVRYAEALVAELAKENKPVYYLWENKYGDPQQMLSSNSGPHPEYVITALYTLPPTAEQIEQETAEAIAKMLDDKDVGRTDYCMHVYEEGEQYKSEAIAAVRNGAWKEYK